MEFVSEPVAELSCGFEPLDNLHYDIDIDPVPECEMELIGETHTELVSHFELETESEPVPPKLTVKKETQEKKRKSSYRRKRTFECYQCSLECSKLYELKTHLTIFHPFEEQKKDLLSCPYCTKTTISRKILSLHLRKVLDDRSDMQF